ncbi:helix-turn-helix transcriptional regulator [Nocardioides ferulae]|uniref:helix-turn-helix transcriptional regulator n=1 Tax=Nocardioides ferulae TaxID=2340821 RepID=UPI000EADC446|nr:helix-turn-helix transcriptional regulator [Nocardioides ferulae]
MEVFTKPSIFDPVVVQRIMDAGALLQVRRSALAAALDAGQQPGAEVVARGLREINQWLAAQLFTWRELLSVRLTSTADALRYSVPNNRKFVAGGGRMVSLLDYYRTEPMVRLLLGGEQYGEYLFCYATVQMKIVDRQLVLLEGPVQDGEPTLMAVSDPGCVAAASAYWRTLMASAFPCTDARSDLGELTPRQRQIVALLAGDASDEQIAKALGISVRTVRYDVAHLLDRLDARSRFAAGVRIGELRGTTDYTWSTVPAPEAADHQQPPASPRIGSGD